MREINLNGYIDDDVWYGDEITPEALHDELYDPSADQTEDVHIRLNSYGGSCNAATRMYDDLAAYPGKVFCTVSGTAASAATVVAMAADRLEMTPGSLWLIHNPSVVAAGDESELMDAIELLRASKESIINVYTKRCPLGRMSISDMMDKATWMDAQAALMNGFIDNIADSAMGGPVDCVPPTRDDAERKVRAWRERHLTRPPVRNAAKESMVLGTVAENAAPVEDAVAEEAVAEDATVEGGTVQASDAMESTVEPEAQSVPDVLLTEQHDDDVEVSPSEVSPNENAPADSMESGEMPSEEPTAPTEATEPTEPTTLTEPTEPAEPRIHVAAIEKRLLHLKNQLTEHI